MQRSKNFRGVLISGIFFMLAAIVCNGFFNRDQAEAINIFQKNLTEKQRRMEKVTIEYNRYSTESKTKLEQLYRDEKLGVYIFSSKGLLYWNNSVIPLKQLPAIFDKQQGVI